MLFNWKITIFLLDDVSACIKDQVQASAWSADFAIVFSPECNQDGSFKTVQCQKSTGYCWCVDRQGSEIWGTRIRGQPKCTDLGKCNADPLYFEFTDRIKYLSPGVKLRYVNGNTNQPIATNASITCILTLNKKRNPGYPFETNREFDINQLVICSISLWASN